MIGRIEEVGMLVQTVSVVVPVFLAGAALQSTVEELLESAGSFDVASTVKLELDEVILVVDNQRLSRSEPRSRRSRISTAAYAPSG